MTILHDVYVALLSGLAYKTGNEIHWVDERNSPVTVEPIDTEECRYVVRRYYSNGSKSWEREYQNGQLIKEIL